MATAKEIDTQVDELKSVIRVLVRALQRQLQGNYSHDNLDRLALLAGKAVVPDETGETK